MAAASARAEKSAGVEKNAQPGCAQDTAPEQGSAKTSEH
jgi:hypothetical protein